MRIRIQLFTLMRIRIQLFTLLRIPIRLFTLMRAQILLFIKLIYETATIGLQNLHFEPPSLRCERSRPFMVILQGTNRSDLQLNLHYSLSPQDGNVFSICITILNHIQTIVQQIYDQYKITKCHFFQRNLWAGLGLVLCLRNVFFSLSRNKS